MSDKYVNLTLTDGQTYFSIEQVISDNRNVVLLGVPGSGKTILLKHFQKEHERECELVQVKQFIKMPVNIKDRTKDFLLDGFDELRCAATEKESKIYDIVPKLMEIEKKCHTLISCREMDWYGDNDDSALEKYLSYPVKKAYVSPLSRDQKNLFADKYLDDSKKATDFQTKILNNREYQEILNVPQTLVMLLDLFKEHSDTFPTRKIKLYEEYVRLSLEKKKTNLREGTYNLSEGDVFKYAGYIAYFYMISDLNDIEYGNLLQISDNPDYKFESLKLVVELNLFENKGHSNFIHRTIAEYLCAHFLYNQKILKENWSEDRVLELLVSKNGKIPSELRGVYAWFSSMTESKKCFSIDPYGQFLYGDNSLFEIASKMEVVKAIGCYANQVKPYFIHFGDAYRKEEFYEPELDSFLIEEYREGLKSKNNYLLFLGLIMTSAKEPTSAILEFSKEIVAKRDLEFHFKEMFIEYLASDVAYLQERLKEIIDGKVNDPEDEFLDTILSILYPKIILPSKITEYLKKYKEHDCYRNQFAYLSKKEISLDELSSLVECFYNDKSLKLDDKYDLLDAVESVIGNYFLKILRSQPPETFLQKLFFLAQNNFTLTNGAWYYKIKDLQNVDEEIKGQLYLNYLINTTVKNVNDKNDVYYSRKRYLNSFVSTILPRNHIDILKKILNTDKTADFKLEILFEMYTRLRSNAKTSDDADENVSEIASEYGLLDRFKKGISYTPSQEIVEMMKKNEERVSERKRKTQEMVDANKITLNSMSQDKKENLWQWLIKCAIFYLYSSETEVEDRLGLCLENYREMLQILKSKLSQDPQKRVYYEYTNIQSLANDAPSAVRNVDCFYYAILCLNGPEDYEKIDDNRFLEYLYLISVQENNVANSKKAEFMNWFEEKRIDDAIRIIQDFILMFFGEKFYTFTKKEMLKSEEIVNNLMRTFDFQLDVELLKSLELKGNLAAMRDSLVKFINMDVSINKNDTRNLIEMLDFRWHSFSLKSIICEYHSFFIESMMSYFDSENLMAFHSGVQSRTDEAAFYVNNVMLNQLEGIEGKKLLNGLLEKSQSKLWKPRLKTRIEEIDEILTDSLKTKITIDDAKELILQKTKIG